ncbi:MAG: RidA family protein [Sphingomonadales bacterium]
MKYIIFILAIVILPFLSVKAIEMIVSYPEPADDALGVEFFNPPEYQHFPFSAAVRVGHMLYMSGQVGNIPGEDEVVPGGIEAETHQIMKNIKATAEKYGSSLDEIVKCTVFIDNMQEWGALSVVYRSYFGANPPARSALGADGLAISALAEIECIATIGLKRVN